jgi:hypothetical protein
VPAGKHARGPGKLLYEYTMHNLKLSAFKFRHIRDNAILPYELLINKTHNIFKMHQSSVTGATGNVTFVYSMVQQNCTQVDTVVLSDALITSKIPEQIMEKSGFV